MVHHHFSFSSGPRALSGSSDDGHAPCDDRIDLYPAAPIRLATMLHAWIISRRWDGTNLWDGAFAKRTFSHTSNPPTCPKAR